jgi:hypothetical protein
VHPVEVGDERPHLLGRGVDRDGPGRWSCHLLSLLASDR